MYPFRLYQDMYVRPVYGGTVHVANHVAIRPNRPGPAKRIQKRAHILSIIFIANNLCPATTALYDGRGKEAKWKAAALLRSRQQSMISPLDSLSRHLVSRR